MKKCQECGALSRGKVSFCPKCGMPTDEMMKKDTFVKYKTAKVICTSKSLSNFWGAYHFVFDLYKTYLDGYLSAMGKSITEREKELLPWGAVLMTYECGMRFLTDYLEGDVYFRTHRERHNLDRARTQFKLVNEMLAMIDQMLAAAK